MSIHKKSYESFDITSLQYSNQKKFQGYIYNCLYLKETNKTTSSITMMICMAFALTDLYKWFLIFIHMGFVINHICLFCHIIV